MKTLTSLASERFRTVFLIFYAFCAILPIMILLYVIINYVRPILFPYQEEALLNPVTYTIGAMLGITLMGMVLMNWWIRSLERLTEDVKRKAASVLSEKIEISGGSEITQLQYHVNGLYGELQGKISQLNEYSKELEKSKKKLAVLASSDELTGLYNRRMFEPKLVEQVQKAQKGKYALSLVMVDVDGFRQYNQAHGHGAGDELLRNLGLLIKDMVRQVGLPFRYGGDEFAIILPKRNTEGAAAVAEKLKATAGRLAVRPDPKGQADKLSVSCAVVTYSNNFKGLLQEGDRCVREAVKRGKGSVVMLAPLGVKKV